MEEIKIIRAHVTDEGKVYQGTERVSIKFPLKIHKQSQISGFSMDKSGLGYYMGPNQMVGGPWTKDLVLFDNAQRPFYARVSAMTQDWHTRRGNVEFICWKEEIWDYIIEGVCHAYNSKEIDKDEFLSMLCKVTYHDKALDTYISIIRTEFVTP